MRGHTPRDARIGHPSDRAPPPSGPPPLSPTPLSTESVKRIRTLAGDKANKIRFTRMDLRDGPALESLFSAHHFDAVIHFAGLKAVGESVSKPLWYYSNNVTAATLLFETMARHNVKTIVFSSSATVYGIPQRVPLDESHPLNALSPYGTTKLQIEQILRDVAVSDPSWRVVLLRYFNPVGAHPSGMIGENPMGIPNNLMPFVQKVALGVIPKLGVFGNDYNTRDGTALRDYIHVMDLADAHVAALNRVLGTKGEGFGCQAINVGTGINTSVMEMVAEMEKASGKKIPYDIQPRRQGDAESVWAATDLATEVLGWKAKYSIAEMVRDQWKWASSNPKGYPEDGRGEVDVIDYRNNKVEEM